MSTFGNILKMLGEPIDDETLRLAEATREGRMIGDHLVAIGAIAPETRALVLLVQARFRAASGVEEVQNVLDEVRRRAAEKRSAAWDLIPPTNPGQEKP